MFLALDSVFNQCSVALLSTKGEVLSQDTQTGKRAQTQQILPMIEAALAQAQVELSELTALIFNRGPGAFSGIRINTAAVQALSVAQDIPCVGVSSLQVLAQAALEQYAIDACYAVHDARMKQVYIGRFEASGSIMRPHVMSDAATIDAAINDNEQVRPQELLYECLLDYEKQTAVDLTLVGDGAALLTPYKDQKIVSEVRLDATLLARIGMDSFNRQGGVPAEQALPVYLRNHAWKTLKEQGKA